MVLDLVFAFVPLFRVFCARGRRPEVDFPAGVEGPFLVPPLPRELDEDGAERGEARGERF